MATFTWVLKWLAGTVLVLAFIVPPVLVGGKYAWGWVLEQMRPVQQANQAPAVIAPLAPPRAAAIQGQQTGGHVVSDLPGVPAAGYVLPAGAPAGFTPGRFDEPAKAAQCNGTLQPDFTQLVRTDPNGTRHYRLKCL